MPLLKNNPLLSDWFLQCFANDESIAVDGQQHQPSTGFDHEYESLNFHKATETADETDVYEHIPQTEIFADPVDNPCHIRYINGRIHYGNRILLPAKLSFTMPNSSPPSQQHDSGEFDSAVTTEASATTSYRCVHGIKKYGDMKLKEQQRIHLDTELNAGHYSADESDRTDDEIAKANRK